jgi:TrmH family RNA methyltransferase
MSLSSLRRVSSRQNPLVSRVRALVRAGTVTPEVLVEGITLVTEAAAAGWPLELVAVSDRALDDPALAAVVEREQVAAERVIVTPAVMDALSPAATPTGAIAIARAPQHTIQGVLEPNGVVVCAVDVQDPGNLGAIARVTEAAGGTGLIVCGSSADPFGWKAVRGAMGSAFRLPIVRRAHVDDVFTCAMPRGWQTVATATSGDAPSAIDFRARTILLVGSEGSGLPPGLVARCDRRASIPMQAPVESLNVAVATAVILYEARRQRATPATP